MEWMKDQARGGEDPPRKDGRTRQKVVERAPRIGEKIVAGCRCSAQCNARFSGGVLRRVKKGVTKTKALPRVEE
jgi:hypothetical protein